MKGLFGAVHESGLAQSGHPELHRTCPLLGVKRTLIWRPDCRSQKFLKDRFVLFQSVKCKTTKRIRGNARRRHGACQGDMAN